MTLSTITLVIGLMALQAIVTYLMIFFALSNIDLKTQINNSKLSDEVDDAIWKLATKDDVLRSTRNKLLYLKNMGRNIPASEVSSQLNEIIETIDINMGITKD